MNLFFIVSNKELNLFSVSNKKYLPSGHCMKSVHIRSFSGQYFPAFGLNTGYYGREKLRIRTLFT